MNIVKVKTHFEYLGFECDDIQADDYSVGIPNGWVIFRDKYKKTKWREISWADAEWHTYKNSNKTTLLKDSYICKDI
jgi:hypothetical protein